MHREEHSARIACSPPARQVNNTCMHTKASHNSTRRLHSCILDEGGFTAADIDEDFVSNRPGRYPNIASTPQYLSKRGTLVEVQGQRHRPVNRAVDVHAAALA